MSCKKRIAWWEDIYWEPTIRPIVCTPWYEICNFVAVTCVILTSEKLLQCFGCTILIYWYIYKHKKRGYGEWEKLEETWFQIWISADLIHNQHTTEISDYQSPPSSRSGLFMWTLNKIDHMTRIICFVLGSAIFSYLAHWGYCIHNFWPSLGLVD